jgi:hypothetical protein
MSSPIDPVQAREALDVVHQQRRTAGRASRDRWWVWLAGFVVLWVLAASRDLGSGTRSAAVVLLIVPLLLWVYLPRRYPALGERLGARIRLHPTAIPGPARFVFAGLGVLFLMATEWASRTDLLARLGAADWLRAHPHAAFGGPFAAATVLLALAVDRAFRARMGR